LDRGSLWLYMHVQLLTCSASWQHCKCWIWKCSEILAFTPRRGDSMHRSWYLPRKSAPQVHSTFWIPPTPDQWMSVGIWDPTKYEFRSFLAPEGRHGAPMNVKISVEETTVGLVLTPNFTLTSQGVKMRDTRNCIQMYFLSDSCECSWYMGGTILVLSA